MRVEGSASRNNSQSKFKENSTRACNLTSFARVLENVKLAPVDCFNSITKPCILAQSKI